MWANQSFSFYMIIYYLKYLPGDIYKNSFASGGADVVSGLVAGFLYSKIGLKNSFSTLLSLSIAGGLIIILMGDSATFWMPVFVIITKLGISGGFNLVYVSTVDIFPTLFSATAMGMCNFVARVLTILAP